MKFKQPCPGFELDSTCPMITFDKINVVFMPANIPSIMQSVDEGLILTFKCNYSRNTSYSAITVIDRYSYNRFGWLFGWLGFMAYQPL